MGEMGTLLVGVVVSLLAFSLIAIAHELGHAIMAASNGRRSQVVIGRHGPAVRMELPWFDICWHPLGVTGSCSYRRAGLTTAQLRAILIAGPWASAACGLFAGLAAYVVTPVHGTAFAVLVMVSFAGFYGAILNLLPIRIRGFVSDGAQLRCLDERSVSTHVTPLANGNADSAGPPG